jgi:hypothetical protein
VHHLKPADCILMCIPDRYWSPIKHTDLQKAWDGTARTRDMAMPAKMPVFANA